MIWSKRLYKISLHRARRLCRRTYFVRCTGASAAQKPATGVWDFYSGFLTRNPCKYQRARGPSGIEYRPSQFSWVQLCRLFRKECVRPPAHKRVCRWPIGQPFNHSSFRWSVLGRYTMVFHKTYSLSHCRGTLTTQNRRVWQSPTITLCITWTTTIFSGLISRCSSFLECI